MNTKRITAVAALAGALAAGAALTVPASAEAAPMARSVASVQPDAAYWRAWTGPYGAYGTCANEADNVRINTGMKTRCDWKYGEPGYANGWWVMAFF